MLAATPILADMRRVPVAAGPPPRRIGVPVVAAAAVAASLAPAGPENFTTELKTRPRFSWRIRMTDERPQRAASAALVAASSGRRCEPVRKNSDASIHVSSSSGPAEL
jgi:hypothetical protein